MAQTSTQQGQTPKVVNLSTERLLITRFDPTPENAEFLVELYNTPDFIAGEGRTGIDTAPKALAALERMGARFDQYGHGVYLVWLIHNTDRPDHKDGSTADTDTLTRIGSVSLMRGDYTAPDIGFALLPAYTKRGYATEAARRIMRHAVEDLGYDGVLGLCAAGNTSSRAALERLGMEDRGVHELKGFGASAVYAEKGMKEVGACGIPG